MHSPKTRVLFLGRKGCEYTEKLSSLLSDAEVVTHLSETRGEKLPEQVLEWSGDYIFAFRSLAIVPMKTVRSATLAAVNFHPGPPEYPGSGSTNFALYEGAKSFGVTAHLIEEMVDSGRILTVRRFPIAAEDNLETLTKKAHAELFSLARELISDALLDNHWIQRLIEGSDPATRWTGKRRKIARVDEYTRISISTTKRELEKRVRAFHHPDFPLTLNFRGRRFSLSPDGS